MAALGEARMTPVEGSGAALVVPASTFCTPERPDGPAEHSRLYSAHLGGGGEVAPPKRPLPPPPPDSNSANRHRDTRGSPRSHSKVTQSTLTLGATTRADRSEGVLTFTLHLSGWTMALETPGDDGGLGRSHEECQLA